MKKLLIIPIALIFGCQPAAPPCECGITGQDKISIRDQEQEYVRGVFESDLSRVEAVLADDIVAMPPSTPEVVGKEAYREMLKSMPELMEYEFLEVEIEGGNNLAYAKGNYVMLFEIDGQEIGDEGSFLEVWQKSPEGTWLLKRNTWNSGIPMVTTDSTLMGN